MSDDAIRPNLWKGASAGLAGGLIASFAMDRFQVAMGAIGAAPPGEGEPATQRAADRIARVAAGRPVAGDGKPAAGQALRYGLGAALGLAYGIFAEIRPEVRAGAGTGFGLGAAAILDDAAVPAAGLGPAPWKTSPNAHLYAVASHLVFGTTAEATRRLVRRWLG